MTVPIFANARVESGGSLQGADNLRHDLFKVTRDAGPDLYGDFLRISKQWVRFQYRSRRLRICRPLHVGNLHPDARQHFSTDESLTIEQLTQSYFLSNPSGTS
jgi:hypothetical protein